MYPNASENASAIAMVNIPPIITALDPEKECNPTINPSVVIVAEVKPKHNPVFNECFIPITSQFKKKASYLSFKLCCMQGSPKVHKKRLAIYEQNMINHSFY